MAPDTRRKLGILAVLLVVLLLVLIYNRDTTPPLVTPGAAATGRRPAAPGTRSVAGGSIEVGTLRLEALTLARPEPEPGARNPFRFRPVAPPPSPVLRANGPGPGALAGPVVPAGPPAPPPIALKFIGLVEQAPSKLKVAVLSDGRNVFYGKEGDVIEGRYRIERIGGESIDMAYVDGRGRQTLRLSGS